MKFSTLIFAFGLFTLCCVVKEGQSVDIEEIINSQTIDIEKIINSNSGKSGIYGEHVVQKLAKYKEYFELYRQLVHLLVKGKISNKHCNGLHPNVSTEKFKSCIVAVSPETCEEIDIFSTEENINLCVKDLKEFLQRFNKSTTSSHQSLPEIRVDDEL